MEQVGPVFGHLVPGHFAEKDRHPTGIGDAGEDQAGADERGQTEEDGVDRPAQDGAEQHQRPRSDANLAFQRYRLLAPHHRQARLGPGQCTAFDVDHVGEAGGQELRAGLLSAAAAAADEVERLVGRSSFAHDRSRIKCVERDIAGNVGVNLTELDRRANVDQVQRSSLVPQRLQFTRCDSRDFHRVFLQDQRRMTSTHVLLTAQFIGFVADGLDRVSLR